MKIGVISNLYPPYDRGGAERIALRVAQELYYRDHDVFAVTSKPFDGVSSFMAAPTREECIGTVYRFFPFNLYHVLKDYKYPYVWKFNSGIEGVINAPE